MSMVLFSENKLREFGVIPKKINRAVVKNTILNYTPFYIENHKYKHSLFARLFDNDTCIKFENVVNSLINKLVIGFTNDKEMKSILQFTCINDIWKILDNHIDMQIRAVSDSLPKEIFIDKLQKELILYRNFLLTKMINSYKIIG